MEEKQQQPLPRRSARSLLVHLVILGAIFYSSGFIPGEEILFAAVASIYLLILSRVAFPAVTPKRPPHVYRGSRLLRLHVSVGALVGLALPLGFILLTGSSTARAAAVPHTVLLVLQIMSEGFASGSDSVSLPIRAFVPISYNGWRLLTIWRWVWVSERASVGWVLAVMNMGFWSFNLFCFLLPLFLPLAMRSYYQAAQKN